MRPTRSGAAAGLVVVALLSRDAAADPRWFWSDVRLTDTPTESVTPHLVAPGYVSGVPLGSVFVTWAEVDPVEGDLEIWAVATFDGGCSFCEPTRLTDNSWDDTSPRIAVLALPTGFWSIQTIFESAGEVVVAWDSANVSYRVPWDQLCEEWRDLGPSIRGNRQYVHLESGAAEPDIAAIGSFAFGHFHAVWQVTGFAGSDVHYAHDLTAQGGAGWTLDPIKDLTSDVGFNCVEPALACDLLTDPDPLTGSSTGDRTAVNVVFVDVSGFGDDVLRGLRSVDSGATFSPSGARVDAPAGGISDTGGLKLNRLANPAIDTASTSFSFTQPIWVATSWDDTRNGPAVASDARYMQEPALPSPDWQTPDEIVTTALGGPPAPDSTIALQLGNAGASAWIAWDSDQFAPSEIAGRGGVLRASAPVADWASFPIAPVRPRDPPISFDFQLSHCAFDDATFGCRPTRTAGEARDAEAAADFQALYLVWSDSRHGQREVYFKRTDTFVSGLVPRAEAGCSGAGTAWVDVSFDQVVTCPQPFSGERMARYLVYHGRDPGGPYDNAASPLEVLHDPASGPTRTVRIDGLAPGTTWHVVVVPEDEARNVFPPQFDPLVDEPVAPMNEVAVVTPQPCEPALTAACRIVADDCPADPALGGDGQLDFGERVDLEVTLTNSGTAAARDWAGIVEAAGAVVEAPPGGGAALALIPAGESRSFTATVRLPLPSDGALCGDPVDLSLTGQTSDLTRTWPDSSLAGCDFALGSPDGNCEECVRATCLYRSDVTRLSPHEPAHGLVYLVPRSGEDIALQGSAYRCPFATGDLEPDANALGNGVPLALYQVDVLIGSLRLAKSGSTIRFTF